SEVGARSAQAERGRSRRLPRDRGGASNSRADAGPARPGRNRPSAGRRPRASMGGDPATGLGGSAARLSTFIDSNILVRHLTGDPPDQAEHATELLRSGDSLIVIDLVVAEVVYVLESVYEITRERLAELVRAVIG